jgi:anti-anti-sigma regulatory factor
MTSTMDDSSIAGPSVAITNAAEFRGGGHTTEITGLTELVRGHDQDVLDRFTPIVRRQSLNLDLHAIERIDAAGIAALILLYRTACDAGHRFTVSNASQRVAEILIIVGLDRILLSQNAVHVSHSGCEMERSAA